uniref:Uncharacterized protein n=1 Tax=Arundo donax TaxID=35708 RepID=A0A0A8ZBG3_ARUDO
MICIVCMIMVKFSNSGNPMLYHCELKSTKPCHAHIMLFLALLLMCLCMPYDFLATYTIF